ncbi:anti-sigma factor RsbA family regulatory protein [Micromonospora echinofusca]|uniref:Sensor histidine kinase n=1 Tax=Micromonospora echinofusca TaxID=47858 RepID=A0ABS3W048_MICEH|nr:anti-sigma factor RsbA family regulatory protein [Micromonospora echinofusca]MBO4210171.1 sensor histidine kinase [Micromonospora echinofusca]
MQADPGGSSAFGGLRHEALFYTGDSDYVAGVGGFVTAGLAAAEPALIAVPGHRLDLLRPLVGADAPVTFVDMTEAGRNPGRIIPGVLHAFLDRHRDRSVRIVGEPIWPGRSAVEYPRCVQHEALINIAFADRPAVILCPYDAVGLDEVALTDAARTHPVLVRDGVTTTSPHYTTPEAVVDGFNRPLAAPDGPVADLRFDATGLSAARALVGAAATGAGLSPERVDDLRIAVTELATNALTHAPTPATLRVWVEPAALVCEVTGASVLTDRLAGRIPPSHRSDRGRGLVLVNQLCDLVEIHTDEGSTTIRLHLTRPGGTPGSAGTAEGGFALASPG